MLMTERHRYWCPSRDKPSDLGGARAVSLPFAVSKEDLFSNLALDSLSLSLPTQTRRHASPLAQRARKAETGPDAVLKLAQRTLR